MQKKSAGILLYRYNAQNKLQVLLVHPGGPYHKTKDEGDWSIPKGEFEDHETALEAAQREFHEETGIKIPDGEYLPLTPVTLKSGKTIHAFYKEAMVDCSHITSNQTTIEFPYGSGKFISIPEVDRAGWFNIDLAKRKLNAGQIPFLEEVKEKLNLKTQ